MSDISTLIGKTLTSAFKSESDYEIIFKTTDGKTYRMHHWQDCCEQVYIESIVGDLNDLIGEPILVAEESSSSGTNKYNSHTWTFYKLATRKGYIDIRWYGTSNGYYSENVDFEEVTE